MRAIILAGGKGSRLKPFTTFIPKPLVPIGGKTSIIEIIIKQLSKCGFKHVTITVNHLSNLIISYLGNGSKFGLKIDYSLEKKELGTIGPLTLIKDLPENFLVMNGDILTNINFQLFYKYHIKKKNEITVATYFRKNKIDYGVVNSSDNIIKKFSEKPLLKLEVSAGIYCFNKKIIKNLKKNTYLGFDKFILDNLKKKKIINTFLHEGIWFDIGRAEDYDYVNENYSYYKKKF